MLKKVPLGMLKLERLRGTFTFVLGYIRPKWWLHYD